MLKVKKEKKKNINHVNSMEKADMAVLKSEEVDFKALTR